MVDIHIIVLFTPTGGQSGSFGAILLNYGEDIDALKNERGHNTQLMMMGLLNYGGLKKVEWSVFNNKNN